MSQLAAPLELPRVPSTARPRVCILAETFHPVIGGGETQARLLAEQLVARGYPVTVLTRRSSRVFARREWLGRIEIRRLGPAGPGGSKRWPMVPFAARELWRGRNQFDVVLVLGFRALGLAAVAASKVGRLPCIFKAESNGEISGEFLRPGLRRVGLAPKSPGVRHLLRARNRAFLRADSFVALSAEIEREFLDAGVDLARVRRIPNGVDADRFRPVAPAQRGRIRQALGLPQQDTLITYAGRLVSYKGLPLLLRVWREIARDAPGARLVLVGEGGGDIHNCEAELRGFVTANGLADRVVFTGPVERVEPLLQASDIFVFPTENEAFGLALVEAMACGLACVATAVGGVPEIVTNGRDGVIIPARDEQALGAALRRLLAEPGLAATLGRAARKTVVARFSISTVTGAYAELIDSLSRRCAH